MCVNNLATYAKFDCRSCRQPVNLTDKDDYVYFYSQGEKSEVYYHSNCWVGDRRARTRPSHLPHQRHRL